MQFLVLFACVVAAASAGHIVAPYAYGAQHLAVIGHDGVPVDTAEVQHARAAHYAHTVDAIARNGDYAYGGYAHGAYAHAAPVVSAYAHAPVVSSYAHASPIVAAYAGHHHAVEAYPTSHVIPQNINGVPLETPEVVAAKHNHFAAHVEANARTALHYRYRRGVYAAPLAYSAYAYGAQHLPVIGHNGVPVDTAEVQHARAAHFAHKADAIARNGDYAYGAYAHGAYAHAAPIAAYGHATHPVVAAAYGAYPYAAQSYGYSGHASPLAHYY